MPQYRVNWGSSWNQCARRVRTYINSYEPSDWCKNHKELQQIWVHHRVSRPTRSWLNVDNICLTRLLKRGSLERLERNCGVSWYKYHHEEINWTHQ